MHRKDGRATQPQAFTVFASKVRGKVGVRIAEKRAYASVSEVSITAAGLLIVTITKDGLAIRGEGVVRQLGDDSIAVTA